MNNLKICIVGLGYVGLPLAVRFAEHFKVIGFDINEKRINELNNGVDKTGEIKKEDFEKIGNNITFTNNEKMIKEGDVIIITVPTPTTKDKKPDLRFLGSASKTVGRNLKKGAIVVYESTTYPGCTEEFCLSILEKESGMKLGEFCIGYSPERINPGDLNHTIDKITKIVAGCNEETTNVLLKIYKKITNVYPASSVRVAESAKVIENIQRDINIALFNELSMLFDKLNIDSKEVFDAAATKWNFLKFNPGFVGGHCLGKDEYVFLEVDGKILFDKFVNICKYLDIFDEDNKIKYNKKIIKTLIYNFDRNRLEFVPILAMSNRVEKNNLIIKDSLNQKLRVSDNHLFIVKDKDSGELTVKFAKDLKIDDLLPNMVKLPEIFKLEFNLLNILPKDILKKTRIKLKNSSWKYVKIISKKFLNVKVSNFRYWDYIPTNIYLENINLFKRHINEKNLILITGRGKSVQKIPCVITLDENFARLIGYYLAEGCISDNCIRITINSNECEILNDIVSILDKLGIRYSTYNDKNYNATTVKISSEILSFLFKHVLKLGTNSYEMDISNELLFSSDNIRLELLKGILRGDGGFSCSEFSYYTSSEKLFQKVIMLLKNFGICPIIKDRKYLLKIFRIEDLEKIYYYGCLTDNKKEKLINYINSSSKRYKSKKTVFENGIIYTKIDDISKGNTDVVYSIEVLNNEYINKNYITSYGIITHNCIPEDPYYLATKSIEEGYIPELILAGRRINENIPLFVANKIVKLLIKNNKLIKDTKICIFGATYKENVPDLRESKVEELIYELKDFGIENITLIEPLIDKDEIFGVKNIKKQGEKYDVIVYAVNHKEFENINILDYLNYGGILIDIKRKFNKNEVEKNGSIYWGL